jgi:D-threo-aldose 1-dehydrogenase
VPLFGTEPTFEPGVWKGIAHDAELRIGYRGIMDCWEQGCELLGGGYQPEMVSVHDPDEYLAEGKDAADRAKRCEDILEAYRALFELKDRGLVKAVGVGAKDWHVIEEIARHHHLLACSMTVYRHPPELLDFMAQLKQRKTVIINSAVFNAGFLIGGDYFDYRKADPVEDRSLFEWRRRFSAVCRRFDTSPAAACVEFGLSVPGTAAVALNTGNPDHVAANVRMTAAHAPAEFWRAMKDEALISPAFPFLD